MEKLRRLKYKKIVLKKHQSGFVSIIGNPYVGKSTLMNSLIKVIKEDYPNVTGIICW